MEPAARASRSLWLLMIGGCIACVAVVGSVWLPMRRAAQRNHIEYLTHARRYDEALAEIRRLADAHGSDDAATSASLAAMRRTLISEAAAFYLAPRIAPIRMAASPSSPSQYVAPLLPPLTAADARIRDRFLAVLDAHEDGDAQEARALRLRLLAQDPAAPTTATLDAARAVLKHDGYETLALWWAARLQYDPQVPLRIPAEVLRFREPLKAAAPLLVQASASVDPEQRTRLLYLTALLALADRDYAQAALQLEALDRLNTSEGLLFDSEYFQLPLAWALLRTGQPGRATGHLRRFASDPRRLQRALLFLLESHLELGELPWAADVLARIIATPSPTRGRDPQIAVRQILARHFGLEPAPWLTGASATDVLGATTSATQRTALLLLLEASNGHSAEPVRNDAGTSATVTIQDPAADLLAGPGPQVWTAEAIALGQFELALTQQRYALAIAWAEALQARCAEVGRLVPGWLPGVIMFARRAAAAPGSVVQQPLMRQELNLLLAGEQTHHLTLAIPSGHTPQVVVLSCYGYPAGTDWPLVYAETWPQAGRTWYLRQARTRPRVLILPVPPAPPELHAAGSSLPLACSLLGAAGESSTTPNAAVGEVCVF